MESEERAADPLAGGIAGRGYQCGMLWGATLAAGAQAYRLFGSGPEAEAGAISAAQRIVESFRDQNNNINCFEITEVDMSSPKMGMIARFLLKSGIRGSCFGMAARYASAAFGEIDAALSEKHVQAPPAAVSCSAMLAQKMVASDMHTVMAAGFAGGIGLSGGACGALGAAIWMAGLNILNDGGKLGYKDPSVLDAIERFLKCTGYEFECSKIVGRKFESIGDHASYLREGGCSEILKVLATA